MKPPDFHIPKGANADCPAALDVETRVRVCIAKSIDGVEEGMIGDDTQLLDVGDSMDALMVWETIEECFRLPKDHLRALFMHQDDGQKTNILQATVGDIARCVRKIFGNDWILRVEQ